LRFAGRLRTTSSAGRATICAQLQALGRHTATATRAGFSAARASVQVVRDSRFKG
jgi:hypothetical protein